MELQEADLRLISQWTHPDYVIEAAKEYGDGDPVLGAEKAWNEVRNNIKHYIKYIRKERDLTGKKDLKLAQALRAMGFVGVRQAVYPLPDPYEWRDFTARVWKKQSTGPVIPGNVDVAVGNASQSRVDYCAIILASRMLKDIPEANRAFLRNKVYKRETNHIVYNFMLDIDCVRSIVFDSSKWTVRQLKKNLVNGRNKIRDIEQHPLRKIGRRVMNEWIESGGLIASAGGLMITCVGGAGVRRGNSALMTDFNGIPTYITVGKVEQGIVNIGVTPDHRAYDGEVAGKIYDYWYDNLPKIVREL